METCKIDNLKLWTNKYETHTINLNIRTIKREIKVT